MSEEPLYFDSVRTTILDINSELIHFDIASLKDFKKWVKSFERFGGASSIEWQEDNETTVRIRLYTEAYVYSISARSTEDYNYLGCVVSTRKPRAGETWTRGNDLSDGPLTFNTWYNIITDIIAYETVNVNPKDPRHIVDIG